MWRGIARQESGQKQKALDDFSKAIELDPTDNYALEQRAKLYREMGQMAKAQADEDLAAQLREKNREQLRRNIEEAKKRKKRS
ncbi:MAG: tetratricopeptide repeat protein [Thermoguttaceae bacterium]|nr:tetratricopeptide repeat protein [Thermoguttaceae bacterium]MDW8038100.1 tetratricopeptide repeat protein [Thermoguttaceae bacterium]